MKELALVINILGTVCMVLALVMPAKRIKTILFLSFLSNAIVATGYLLAGSGMNGAISCYVGAGILVVNFLFRVCNKDVPKWLLVVYALAFVGLNMLSGFSYLYFIAVAATLAFVISSGQENGAMYRVWTLVNLILWCSYDILAHTYSSLIPHGVMLASTLVGMIVQDRKIR